MARDFGFASKNLLIVGLIIFLIVGLVLGVYLVQKPTNLASKSSGCDQKPSLVLDSSDAYESMVVYHLKLINNCSSHNDFSLEVSDFPSSPKHYDTWTWMFKNGIWNAPYVKTGVTGTQDVSLTIARPADKNGMPTPIENGIYQNFNVKASLVNNPSLNGKLDLIYKVD